MLAGGVATVLRVALVGLAVGAAGCANSAPPGRVSESPAGRPAIGWGTRPWQAPATTTPTTAAPPMVAAPSTAALRPTTLARIPAGGVTAIGDSVMLDAGPSLEAAIPAIAVDAAVGRQVSQGIALIAQLNAAGGLRKSVVFALGTNGTFSESEFDHLVQLTTGRHLIVVTVHCGHCGWTNTNNAMIRANCGLATHCSVADWYPLAQEHPAWFVDGADGVHMPVGGIGTETYAAMVIRALTA